MRTQLAYPEQARKPLSYNMAVGYLPCYGGSLSLRHPYAYVCDVKVFQASRAGYPNDHPNFRGALLWTP